MANLAIRTSSKQCIGWGNVEFVDNTLRVGQLLYSMFTSSNTTILPNVPAHPYGPIECWVYDNSQYSVSSQPMLDAWMVEHRKQLIAEIEMLADKVGESFVSSGIRISEYMSAKDEAISFKANSYSGDVPPAVQTWALAASISAQVACDDILRDADYLYGLQMLLRQKRLTAREVIKVGTYEQITSAYITAKRELLAILASAS